MCLPGETVLDEHCCIQPHNTQQVQVQVQAQVQTQVQVQAKVQAQVQAQVQLIQLQIPALSLIVNGYIQEVT